MSKDIYTLIRKFKRECEDNGWKYMDEMRAKYKIFCIDNGGHFFNEWQQIWTSCVGGYHSRFQEYRVCEACGHKETKEIQSELERIERELSDDTTRQSS